MLKTSVRNEFLSRVNALRALHQLPPVTYSAAENDQMQQSSLMQAANRSLSIRRRPADLLHKRGCRGRRIGQSDRGLGHGLPWSTEDDNLAAG